MELDSTASPAKAVASYGKACTNCARAKAKCVRSDAGGSCERCSRLSKTCSPAPVVRRSGVSKSASMIRKTRLEEKLDGLVSLLKSTPQPQVSITDHSAVSTATVSSAVSPASLGSTNVTSENELNDGRLCSRQAAEQTALEVAENHHGARPGLLTQGLSLPSNSLHAESTRSCSMEDANEARRGFERFRSHMLPYYPFMSLPANTPAQEFSREHPFLWLVIMAITARCPLRQLSLGKEIRHEIGRRMFVESERSLDLLQGLIAYAAWGHTFIFHKAIVTPVLQLAVGLLGDLGLKKQPTDKQMCIMLEYDARGCPRPCDLGVRTLEEKRAAIACFSVSQLLSSYLQKTDTMRWIPCFDEYTHMLGEAGDAGDSLLVQIVKLQLILERSAPTSHEIPGTSRPPASFYISAFNHEMQSFKSQIPSALQDNKTLQLHIYHSEMSIHEGALSIATNFSNILTHQRLTSLWACLEASRMWFELFLTLSPMTFLDLPMSVNSQLAHCLVALSRLSSFNHPEWDLKLVRQTVNFSDIIENLADKFTQSKIALNLKATNQEEPHSFLEAIRRLQSIKEWWKAKLAAEESSGQEKSAVDQMFAGAPIDFSDDAWLRDMLSLDNFQFDQFIQ